MFGLSVADLLAVLPLLAIVLPLLWGRFPGEAVIERLARNMRPPRARRQRDRVAPRRPAVAGLLRSRLLIAASLAERPPPSPAIS